MTGDGGTPPVPAGYVPPSQPDQAAGSRAGILRAREVIVSGPSGAPIGVFVYAAGTTPALGNPPIVAITNQTQDPFGNSLKPADSPASVAEFIVLGTGGSYLQAAVQAGFASLLLGTGDAAETLPGELFSQIIGAGGTRQAQTVLSSPQFTTNPATIAIISQSQDGTVASSINLQSVNRTNFGLSGNAWWADGTQQLNLPAAGGPFIFGEGFHTISNAAGFSGTMRVKLLPWNAVWLDVELTVTSAGGVSAAFGSLPSSAYYPTTGVNRHIPLSLTGQSFAASGSFLGTPRVNIPTAGAVHVEIPTLTASASLTLGCSTMYPTN